MSTSTASPSPLRRGGINPRTLILFALAGVVLCGGAWLALGLANRGGSESPNTNGQAPRLSDYGVVPNLSLTERSGQQLSLDELKGEVWVANFIFTRCEGSCLAMSTKMQELQNALQQVEGVRLVSFTVDPENDTPEKLTSFAEKYQADGRKWLFLRGSESAIQQMAKETFKLPFMDGTDPKEPIIHSSRFVLMDQQMHIRGYYGNNDPDVLKKLIADIMVLKDTGAE
ncbi:MAG: SCO family protein [Chlorobi bacterium]|nr:SCO family protein [Chlorobiota bacterium]